MKKVELLKYCLPVFLNLITTFGGKAQFYSDTSFFKTYKAPPKLILKIDLLSVWDKYSTPQLALEHRLKNNLYLQHEVGYVTSFKGVNLDFLEDDHEKTSGFKLKNEIRYYFDFERQSRNGVYLAGEILVSYVYHRDAKFFGIGCDNQNGCDFYRQITYRTVDRNYGMHLKIGVNRLYKEIVSIDTFLGMGYKWNHIRTTGFQADDDIIDDTGLLTPESIWKYNLTIGLKVGIILK
ncbi:DUF3575 domain-containing protein [Fulvivirgaceae bacterium BMA10]|uniref:DUF3575 domain-containing protein n=1 Tax=Splendidivirga corallicola TaxID=3051826 RepID=A0ABT8KKH2_9BACT|nr:DUF3575 domain-containing protein [Fulvivirgaceae bacterium BMA10]